MLNSLNLRLNIIETFSEECVHTEQIWVHTEQIWAHTNIYGSTQNRMNNKMGSFIRIYSTNLIVFFYRFQRTVHAYRYQLHQNTFPTKTLKWPWKTTINWIPTCCGNTSVEVMERFLYTQLNVSAQTVIPMIPDLGVYTCYYNMKIMCCIAHS